MDYEMPIGPLPVELDQITPDVLNAALSHRFQNPAITALRIDEAHHGFSTVLRVHLDAGPAAYAAGLPRSVILKGQFEEATKLRGRKYTYKSLEMEYEAYAIMPGLGLNMPEVYFKQMDPGQKQMMILMEDLALRDVHFQHGLRPNTPGQVRQRLTALADFHARTWGSADLEGKYGHLNRNGAAMFVDYMDHAGFDAAECDKYFAMPRGQACPQKFLDSDWLRRILLHAAALSDASPNCLIHGDTHLGNLYEEADGTPGFFDPLVRREHGMLEATYHICNGLDLADRRTHDRELVAHYRSELIARGIAMPSLAETMHQYAAYLSINLATFLLNHPTYQSESFNTAHAVKAAIAMLDNNSYDVV